MEKTNHLEENTRLKGAIHLRASCVEGNDKKCFFFFLLVFQWGVFLKTFSFLVTFLNPGNIGKKLELRDQSFYNIGKVEAGLSF